MCALNRFAMQSLVRDVSTTCLLNATSQLMYMFTLKIFFSDGLMQDNTHGQLNTNKKGKLVSK